MFKDVRTGRMVPCNFVFHIDGRPLKYREIQYRYDKALKKAGLKHKYSATHILRHSMANLVRERLGLEHAQAVGGWKTRSLVEHVYTQQPAHLTHDALKNIENFMLPKDEDKGQIEKNALETLDGKSRKLGICYEQITSKM